MANHVSESVARRLSNELADLAIGSPCLTSYRRATLQRIQTTIGFDFGTLHNTRRGATGHGYDTDDATLSERQSRCVGAFTDAEIRRISRGDVVLVEEAFAARRREQLRDAAAIFSTDSSSGANWGRATAVGFIGVFIVRTRGQPFGDAERSLLASLAPIITLAEAFHGAGRDHAVTLWANQVGLSRRQREVVELVIRGCTNREIAVLLSCSEFTVRNHLVSVFKRAGVESRQELTFQALTHETSACALEGYRRADRIAASAVAPSIP